MCKKRKIQLHLWAVYLATWNEKTKQNEEDKKDYSWKLTLWNFTQPLCCFLEISSSISLCEIRDVISCATSNIALRFLWALGGTNSKLQAKGHLGPSLRYRSENGGLRLVGVWKSSKTAWKRAREGALPFWSHCWEDVNEWGLLSLSHGKSLPVLAVAKTTERKTEMRDRRK